MYHYKNCAINTNHITHIVLGTETLPTEEGKEPITREVCVAYMTNGHQVKFSDDPKKSFEDLKQKMTGWFE